jgi:hypothetical protein
MNYIYALEIKLNRVVTERPELGLYTVSGGSFFRWCEFPLAGVADTWLPGVISEIGNITKRGSFNTGGGMVSAEGFNVRIFNNNQFSLKLEELDISLSGLTCKVIEFVGNDEDSDSVEIYNQYDGCIEDVTAWNELELVFNVKTARGKRRNNISTVLSENKIEPITFGIFNPTFGEDAELLTGSLAKMVRSQGGERILYNYEIEQVAESGLTHVASVFPITAHTAGTLIYRCRLDKIGGNFTPMADLTDVYVKVIDGTGSNQIRKVNSWIPVLPGAFYELEFTLLDYLKTDLSFVESGDGISWVQFVVVDRKYIAESSNKVKGFINSERERLSNNPELFAYSEGAFYELPGLSYNKIVNNNSSHIDPKLSSVSDIDNVISFITKKPLISLYDGVSLSNFMQPFFGSAISTTKIEDGVFLADYQAWVWSDPPYTNPQINSVAGAFASLSDRSVDSSVVVNFSEGNATKNTIFLAFKIQKPEFPKAAISKIYIAMNASRLGSVVTQFRSHLYVMVRRFLGNPDESLKLGYEGDFNSNWNDHSLLWKYESFPDSYYFPFASTASKHFYVNNNGTFENHDCIFTGIDTFESQLYGTDKQNYGSIDEMVLLYRPSYVNSGGQSDNHSMVITLREIAFLFAVDTSIKDSIYSRFAGRSFVGCGTGPVTSGTISGVFAENDHMLDVSSINTVPLAHGSSVFLKYNIANAVLNFGVYETYNGTIIDVNAPVFINPSSLGHAQLFTLAQPTANGFCILCRHSSSSQYDIQYFIQQGRNVTSEAMEDPITVLEHVVRLQNFGYDDSLYTYKPRAKDDYSDSAKIKLSGEGSFDSTLLNGIKNLKIARQFFNYDNCWTDSLIRSLCETFFLVSYQDNDGNECLKGLLIKENPSTAITFGDIVGDVGDMIEPEAAHTYCNPIINYAWDSASETFKKQIRIESVNESGFSPEFVTGISNSTTAANLWNSCKALFDRTQQIEPIPGNLRDQYWIADDETTAIWYLQSLINLMSLKRCSFNLSYSAGRKFDVGMHFMLQLPHETNNNQIECVIEQVVKKKNENRVWLQVILLDEIQSSFFFDE